MVASITEPQTLEGALQGWCEPSLVAEMLQLQRQGFDCPIWIIGGEETESDRKKARYEKLRKQLEDEIVEKLRAGELIATGYDPRAPIDAAAVAIPADRWRTLTVNFKESSAASAGGVITGIQVARSSLQAPASRLPAPRLRIIVGAHQAQLDGTDLNLTHRSFRILLILARAAAEAAHVVPKQKIESELFAAGAAERAVAQAVWTMKKELVSAGLERDRMREWIENRRGVGYRLRMAKSDIQVIE